MNLLEETVSFLSELNIKESEILWVGSRKLWFTWEDFKRLADIEYDESYGAQEVAPDLVIVGKDFWLERGEYDGSEWWEFKKHPDKPIINKIPKSLIGKLWNNLDEL